MNNPIDITNSPLPANVIFEGAYLTDEEVEAFIRANSLETHSAVLAWFQPDMTATHQDINQGIKDMQGGHPLYQPSDNYYPDICNRLASYPVNALIRSPAIRSKNLLHEFRFTTKGWMMDRGVAGHMLEWAGYGLPYRQVLGQPHRLPHARASSTMIRLAVLSLGSVGRPINNNRWQETFGESGVTIKAVSDHLRKLGKAGLLEKSSKGHYIKKEYRPAVQQLLAITASIARLDMGFFKEGQVLADRQRSNPHLPYYLKRVETTSNWEEQRPYIPGIADQAAAYIIAQSIEVNWHTVRELFGQELSTQRRQKLRLALCARPDLQSSHIGRGMWSFSSTSS